MYSLQIFDKNKITYNWATLLVGLKLDLLDPKEVSKYAEKSISANPPINNDILIELAWTKNSIQEVTSLIDSIQ